jgi:hypothetical protein
MTPTNFLPANRLFFSEQPAQQKSPTVLRRAIIQSDQNNFPEALRSFQSGGSITQNAGKIVSEFLTTESKIEEIISTRYCQFGGDLGIHTDTPLCFECFGSFKGI